MNTGIKTFFKPVTRRTYDAMTIINEEKTKERAETSAAEKKACKLCCSASRCSSLCWCWLYRYKTRMWYTVINKPFKNGVKDEFSAEMHQQFENHIGDQATWEPNLKMSSLKPLMGRFVQGGIDRLTTPEMRVAIQDAFLRDGLFRQIRREEQQVLIIWRLCLKVLIYQ